MDILSAIVCSKRFTIILEYALFFDGNSAQKQQEPRSRLPVWCEIRAVSDGLRAALLLDLRPGVAQRHGAVEDRSVLSRVGIDAEVPLPLELVERARRGAAHARL